MILNEYLRFTKRLEFDLNALKIDLGLLLLPALWSFGNWSYFSNAKMATNISIKKFRSKVNH